MIFRSNVSCEICDWLQSNHYGNRNDTCNLGGGVTPYNGLNGEVPPERGTFFRLQAYKRVGISHIEVYQKGREIGHVGI